MKTIYFSNCMAAFEGGGVKGAAYAGAYFEAMEAGIRFNRVAGSSAGSIVAAFIAAGATREFLKSRMLETDFSSLKSPPRAEASPFPKSSLPWQSRFLPRGLREAAEMGGFFGTSAVRDWVEKNLRELLTHQGKDFPSRMVRFRDVKIPLHIIATDILQREAKVWSTELTPDDAIAPAVEASCAIPVFFQPVKFGTSILVDGGAVSNLPTFVLPPNSGHPGRFSDRTIAFRLKGNAPAPGAGFNGPKDYALGLADTLVNSATHIQQSLQDGVYTIEIDTGDIRSTDFDNLTSEKRETLFANGVSAVRRFVEREKEIVGRHAILSQFVGYDEQLLVYVDAISQAQSTIWISDYSTYWLWFIFPTIAAALRRGVQIRIAAGPSNPSKANEEAQRRSLLKSMGCSVHSVPSIGFTGILVDYPGEAATAVISSERGAVGQDYSYEGGTVKVYRSGEDLPVIRSLGDNLLMQLGSSSGPTGLGSFDLEPMPRHELFDALRRVPQYKDAQFEDAELSLDGGLRASQTHVKEFKLLQVDKLASELTRSSFELFAPCRYRLPDGSSSIITPPIVEIHPQGPVIIEGHTRAFYAATQNRASVRAILVSKVDIALPVETRPFFDLNVATKTMGASVNMPGHVRHLIRNIEQILHS